MDEPLIEQNVDVCEKVSIVVTVLYDNAETLASSERTGRPLCVVHVPCARLVPELGRWVALRSDFSSQRKRSSLVPSHKM